MLSSAGKTVLSKDLCNLKRSLEGSDEAELLMREIANCQNNHKAKVIAITDEAKQLQILLVQTAHMQRAFESFPEVLLLDATYRTNKLKMPLFVFLVQDGCGASQVVGYAFVASEQYHVLSKLLETFVKENPSSQETQVVVVDKDFTAINAIRNTFTSAPSVQLCQFHVVKAFGVAAGRLGRSLEEKQKMICTFKEMLHAPTMEKFEEVKADFHRYASKEAVAYFDENWGSITEMWVRHICDREFTFGDNTTNRVESHNNLIKKVLKSSSKLHEALANLLKLAGMSRQNTCHAATLLKTCNFYSYNTSHDIERQCEKVLTPYACRLVSKQLMKMEESNRAIRKTAEDKYEVASGVGDACHQVCLDSQSSSCTTFSKMGLLCRHFLAVCVKLSTKPDLDKAVHKRWFKNYQMSFVGPCEDVNSEESHCPENVEIVSMPGPSFKKMNRNQRYNFAMQTLKALADTLADCRPEFFQARLRHLEDINAVWLKGDDAGEAGCSEERTTEANCGDHDQCSSEQHDNVPENGSQINHTQNKRKQDVEENDVPIKLPMVKTRGRPTKRLRQRKLKKLRKGGQPMPFLELSSKEQEKCKQNY